MTYSPEIVAWPEDLADQLPVSEIFHSIQGEGRFAGYPALFIRLMYCNLGCAWCDTRYTWEQGAIDASQLMTLEAIAEQAVGMIPPKVGADSVHIVITGGEPMLHQSRIPTLIDKLRERGFGFVEIETNGMFEPSKEMIQRISWWNCSPKLSNNGISPSTNIVSGALKKIQETAKCDFKFVIQTRRDLEELEASYLPLIPRERIMLMPEGTTRERLSQVSGWLIEECRNRGYRFSPRVHIMTWGNQRGR
jgi:organic radical activating enzyme